MQYLLDAVRRTEAAVGEMYLSPTAFDHISFPEFAPIESLLHDIYVLAPSNGEGCTEQRFAWCNWVDRDSGPASDEAADSGTTGEPALACIVKAGVHVVYLTYNGGQPVSPEFLLTAINGAKQQLVAAAHCILMPGSC